MSVSTRALLVSAEVDDYNHAYVRIGDSLVAAFPVTGWGAELRESLIDSVESALADLVAKKLGWDGDDD